MFAYHHRSDPSRVCAFTALSRFEPCLKRAANPSGATADAPQQMRGPRGFVDYLRRMVETMRSCSRTGCRWPAAASLSFRYASREVWLLDLAESHPSLYDMCPHHADALVVPQGWATVDERTVREVVHEPSAAEIADRAAREREGASLGPRAAPEPAAEAQVNRYADLARELPRIAAELAGVGAGAGAGAGVSGRPAQHHTEPAGAWAPHGAPQPPQPSSPPPSQAMFSRDLAPVPPPGAAERAEGADDIEDPFPDDIPGQLAIPVAEDDGVPDAVVVSISAARRPQLAEPPSSKP